MSRGTVVLVGAGPGDPDLLTVRAVREIERAEVLLYDALIPEAIVDLAPAGCERIDVGKRGDGTRGASQDSILELLIEKAQAGHRVVRLKGGDPFVFGRGGEEASALSEASIPCEIVPGVSSAVAVPAYAGIPVTDRRYSSSFAVVTGHRGKQPLDERTDWEGLARSAETLVILMGTRWLSDIVARVIDGGRDPQTPAAVIESGTTPRQRVVTAPLAELPERVRDAGLRPPTTIVIGQVANLRESLLWYERRPLFGRRVAVTRASEQATGWTRSLLKAGAEPVSVPLLAFSGPEDPAPLERALESLESYDWLVLTSANAVRALEPHLGGDTLPPIACIGPATASAAREAGWVPALTPAGASTPETLVAALADRTRLAEARILYPRAAGAREELAEALERRGAKLDAIDAYQTVPAPGAGARLAAAIDSGLDAILLASPSAVSVLFECLGQAGVESLARRSVLACIGPTTAKSLRDRGLESPVVSDRQTGDDLVGALARHFAEESDGLS